MISALMGVVGAGMFALAYGSAERSGALVAAFICLGILCFGVMITGTSKTPGFLLECDEYSRFASSC